MADCFWIVWNPKGRYNPIHQHPTEEAAIAEAKRLAENQPGDTFNVLQSVGHALKPREPEIFERHDYDDGIPF